MLHLIGTIIILLSITVNSGLLYADQSGENSEMSPVRSIPETTNIHYTGKYCLECHERTSVDGKDKALKYGRNFTQLCDCHGYKPGTYIHPVDIFPSVEKKPNIPSDLPLYEGKLACITCHDIHLQCEDDPELKIINKRFLRGAPYQSRTDLCFRCHDEHLYSKLNPHKGQLDANGNIVVEKCLYCHIEKPDELRASFDDVKFIGDLLIICKRCHRISVNHPANAKHLVLPSVAFAEKIKRTEKQFGIVLPLDYDGKIMCATCHNPHQKGVIPSGKFGAVGASEEYKKRFQGNICLACHEK